MTLGLLVTMTSCKDKFNTDDTVYSSRYVATLPADGFGTYGNNYYAILHGHLSELVDMNELPASDFGFEYGQDPKLEAEVKTIVSQMVEGEDNRGFRSRIDDLSQSTTYYYRAFVKVGGNIERGNIISFTTDMLHPSSVDLDESQVYLKFGETETIQLTATVNPPKAPNQEVDWVSSKPSVATVTSTGFVTAMGTGFTIITVTTRDGGKQAQCRVDVQEQDRKAINLGLSSGVKWANMNIGATNEADAGWYFQWGIPGQAFDPKEDGYKYKLNGTTPPDKLFGSDDAATSTWGSPWRMPTSDELDELLNDCVWSLVTIRGMGGFRVVKNGNSIFLPFAGYCYKSNVSKINECGYYWASTRRQGPNQYYDYVMADCLKIYDDGSKTNNMQAGYIGYSVRAVQ